MTFTNITNANEIYVYLCIYVCTTLPLSAWPLGPLSTAARFVRVKQATRRDAGPSGLALFACGWAYHISKPTNLTIFSLMCTQRQRLGHVR